MDVAAAIAPASLVKELVAKPSPITGGRRSMRKSKSGPGFWQGLKRAARGGDGPAAAGAAVLPVRGPDPHRTELSARPSLYILGHRMLHGCMISGPTHLEAQLT